MEKSTSQLELEIAELRRINDANNKLIQHQAAEIRLLRTSTSKKESYYQQLLEKKLNGKRLYIAGVGITDITTPDMHVEIKRWSRYHEVPGQLAKYQQGCRRTKSAVYFFGTIPSLGRQQQIAALMAASRINMYSIDAADEITEHIVTAARAKSKAKSRNPVKQFFSEKTVLDTKAQAIHVMHVRDEFSDWMSNKGADPMAAPMTTAFIKKELISAGYIVPSGAEKATCCGSKSPVVYNLTFVHL